MLAEAFLAQSSGVYAGDSSGLEGELQRVFDRARADWPQFSVPAEAFAAHLGRKSKGGLSGLQSSALYLALACARGEAKAIAELERRFMPEVDQALARFRGRVPAEDIKQQVRTELLVREGGRAPKIEEYAGRGDFGRWLRAIAIRTALNVLGAQRRSPSQSIDELGEMAVGGGDPQLEHMKRTYGDAFKKALREALGALDAERRLELRQYYVDGLGVESLGAMYRVAPSTISRRLTRTREELLEKTRAALGVHLKISAEEVESILRQIESRIELTFGALQ